jgi:hypothetical protein
MTHAAVLLRKEARQQAWSLSVMTMVLLAIGVVRWLTTTLSDRSPSSMDGAAALIAAFVPAASLLLGHRLIVREYQGKSQLFLEALPIRRSTFVIVKFGFGLSVLSVSVLGILLAFACASHELTARPFAIWLLRAMGYAASCWSVFFAMGFLGRFRLPAYLTLALGLYALGSLTEFELARFGPIALIEPVAFVYERSLLPWRALLESALLSLAFMGLGFGVALSHEGSVAELLARRAPAREVGAVTVLVLVELGAMTWVTARRKQAPFEFTGDAVARSADRRANVMYGFPELEARGRAVLGRLEKLQAYLTKELAVPKPPALQIAHSSLLDGAEVRSGNGSGDGSSVLLRTNLGAVDLADSEIAQHSFHASLLELSDGGTASEANHWFLDGFSAYAANEVGEGDAERQWLRALAASRHFSPSFANIVTWEHLMERCGEPLATAVAFTLVDTLSRRHGRDNVLRLAKDTLTRPASRGWFSFSKSRQAVFESHFRAIMHEAPSAFVAAWSREFSRGAATPARADALARVPLDSAILELRAGRFGSNLHYVTRGPSLERERTCVVLHGVLRPYDIYYPPHQLERFSFRWAAGETHASGIVPTQYGLGQRVFAALECDVPILSQRERLTVVRLEGN